MPYSLYKSAIALTAAMLLTVAVAQAFDESKYPDLSGQWKRPAGISNQYDTSKPRTAEEAPLTPEYQKIFEANLKDQAEGGQGTDPTYTCIPDGMPRAMNVIFPMEIVVTPKTTYVMIEYLHAAPDLYRRARMAQGLRAELHGLLDRQLGRPGPQWPLPDARGRDAPFEGAAHL